MWEIRVLGEAAQDIASAGDFYEGVEPGVGDYFSDSIIADLERLVLSHGIHPRFFGLHRALADHFPFGIYYRETGMRTEIIAVLDLRRDPAWIRSELTKRNG